MKDQAVLNIKIECNLTIPNTPGEVASDDLNQIRKQLTELMGDRTKSLGDIAASLIERINSQARVIGALLAEVADLKRDAPAGQDAATRDASANGRRTDAAVEPVVVTEGVPLAAEYPIIDAILADSEGLEQVDLAEPSMGDVINAR